MNRLHPQTDKLISSLKASSWHAILLSGPKGVGLQHVTQTIHDKIPGIVISPDTAKANPVITVETVRNLYEQTRSKSTTSQYVTIYDADTMTTRAQTAFLKLLEEPGDSIRFILTSHSPERLLATVRSRLQHHAVLPISSEQTDELIASLGIKDQTIRRQLRFIAGGLPDELEKLVNDSEYFETNSKLVTDAKQLLSHSTYEKLLLVNAYREDRSSTLQLITAAINIIRKSLSLKPSHTLMRQLENLLEAEEHLRANGSVRLILTRLVLQ